jgi:uncharacterized protein
VALPPPTESSTALVTGASSGIGAAIARELAGRGHGVTLVARREERLRELADELVAEHGIRAETIASDLGDPGARDEMATEIDARGLLVEVLVDNAGFGAYGTFVEIGRERQLDMVRLNVEAIVDLMGRYLPAMQERRRGAVINIASVAAFQPLPDNAAYAATKAFVLSLGESTHAELKGTGVSVTTVCPGPVRTEFMDVADMSGAEAATPGFVWTTAEDVAEQAVKGAERGKRVVVPGMLSRATAIAGQHSPRFLALPLAKEVWRRAVP